MISLTNFTEENSTPKAVRLILRRGNYRRVLWLPVSQLNIYTSRIDLKEGSEWLFDQTIEPVLAQGWEGLSIDQSANVENFCVFADK